MVYYLLQHAVVDWNILMLMIIKCGIVVRSLLKLQQAVYCLWPCLLDLMDTVDCILMMTGKLCNQIRLAVTEKCRTFYGSLPQTGFSHLHNILYWLLHSNVYQIGEGVQGKMWVSFIKQMLPVCLLIAN